jgi:hypothetical protein
VLVPAGEPRSHRHVLFALVATILIVAVVMSLCQAVAAGLLLTSRARARRRRGVPVAEAPARSSIG